MLKRSSFHTNTHMETIAPLITCVIDYTFIKTTPDIDQALLQFIDVMNLLDPLLHFSHIFVDNRVQICTCLLYTSPSPRDGLLSRMPSSA